MKNIFFKTILFCLYGLSCAPGAIFPAAVFPAGSRRQPNGKIIRPKNGQKSLRFSFARSPETPYHMPAARSFPLSFVNNHFRIVNVFMHRLVMQIQQIFRAPLDIVNNVNRQYRFFAYGFVTAEQRLNSA